MSLFPDQPLHSTPPKPKLTVDERHARQADRQKALRLRMMIWRALDARNIISPSRISAALSMPILDATKLLTYKLWREGDVALLEAAATRMGLDPKQI